MRSGHDTGDGAGGREDAERHATEGGGCTACGTAVPVVVPAKEWSVGCHSLWVRERGLAGNRKLGASCQQLVLSAPRLSVYHGVWEGARGRGWPVASEAWPRASRSSAHVPLLLPPGSRYLSCASFQVQAKSLNASLPGDNGCDQVRCARACHAGDTAVQYAPRLQGPPVTAPPNARFTAGRCPSIGQPLSGHGLRQTTPDPRTTALPSLPSRLGPRHPSALPPLCPRLPSVCRPLTGPLAAPPQR